jgi:hypothetical protein
MDKAICGAFYYNYLQAGTAAPTPQTGDWLPCRRRARPLPIFQTDKGAPPPSSVIIHPSSFPKVPPPTTPVSPRIGGQNLSPAPVLKCLHRVTPILKETAEPSLSNPQSPSIQPPAVARTPAAPWRVRSSWPSASLPASPSPPAPPPRRPKPTRTSTTARRAPPNKWPHRSDVPGSGRESFLLANPAHPSPMLDPFHTPKGSSLR